MPDKLYPPPIEQLLGNILHDYKHHREIFGISEEFIYNSSKSPHLYIQKFGQTLHNPVGLAAGPHTQMAQNIVAGWLYGARYIELKTIQAMDELTILKPCIDMQDEGYNCEWSQELKIRDSFDQYLNAWIIIHIINHLLYKNKKHDTDIGTIFDMSIGYDLDGIMARNVQWFLDKMQDCSEEKQEKIEKIAFFYPDISKIEIPDKISCSVTLSTMHGCPPQEIGEICKYLLTERNLNTTLKLNPTLLGEGSIRAILNSDRGYDLQLSPDTFSSDLSYRDAIGIIESLRKIAPKKKLQFSVKLTNTLECLNHKAVFSESEEKMYLSGKALHPIAVNLAAKLQQKFNGLLDISFSGGVDCFNITHLLQSGLSPITVCSDLLKPGGYGRLVQYFENIGKAFKESGSKSIDEFVKTGSGEKDFRKAGLENLKSYAIDVLSNEVYKKDIFIEPDIKTDESLTKFDCIQAPCVGKCPTNQEIPDYMWYTSQDDFSKALKTILRTNPFPGITGMICDHPCHLKCTRINYDNPVLIREIKRYINDNAPKVRITKGSIERKGMSVAIVGAGPTGLSCGWFLNLAGFRVDIFESKKYPGGIVTDAIPDFRISDEAINNDIARITHAGVNIHFSMRIGGEQFDILRKKYDYIYIAIGTQISRKMRIIGSEANGVMDPLKFLCDVKERKTTKIGKNIAVIGGGNTAMDVARAAWRAVGEDGNVTIIYRRTTKEMPADVGEIKAVMDEGITILEQMIPVKILTKAGKVAGVECMMVKMGDIDQSGRPAPSIIPDTNFSLVFDTIIPAIGHELDIDFIDHDKLKPVPGSYKTSLRDVLVGGDAMRGPSTAINAIGDGRKAAEEILKEAGMLVPEIYPAKPKPIDMQELKRKKITRQFAVPVPTLPPDKRRNTRMVISTLNRDNAVAEANRCLQCDVICDVCVMVCPNLANYSFEIDPSNLFIPEVFVGEDDEVKIEMKKMMPISQQYQVLNLADWCNECGNCTTFCPTNGRPFETKPRVYFNKKSFMGAEEGFLLQ
nr:FAD-dependent oxidoreductase [Bacteroidota bacterium]